ncbi:MAG: DEAD/DEAH box helicase family protein [Desulfobacula sp.]|nr:DEAD/DEAH box helicase family protein [Desulfobacula sp.]
MKFILNNKLVLENLTDDTRQIIKHQLTLNNPKFSEAQRMGRYTRGIEPVLYFFEESKKALICPRGAATQIYKLCHEQGETLEFIDKRHTLEPIAFNFSGELRPLQLPAVKSCLKKDFGLLESPTGSGKTTMALYMIAKRKQPTLIVVHTKELLNQWMDRIEQFLNIPKSQIGMIGSGKFKIGDKITVAMIQTLYKKAVEVTDHIGHIVVDECHRCPSRTFTQALTIFNAKFMIGLTATAKRRDKLSKVIFWYIGDVTGRIEKQNLLEEGNLCDAEVRWIETNFNTQTDTSEYYSQVLSELTENYQRNRLICDTVQKHKGPGIRLILSDRKEHCQTLYDTLLKENGIKSEVLTGATSPKKREKIIQDLLHGRCEYLIATGQLIGEGFDLPGISTMFLTTPVKFSGRLIQYIGRALRPAPGKDKAIIFDFVDVLNPVFEASARSRAYTYEQQNIKANI